MQEKVPLGVERHRALKKKKDIEHWQKMFDSINNPEQISEARVIEERRKSREEKIKDTGL